MKNSEISKIVNKCIVLPDNYSFDEGYDNSDIVSVIIYKRSDNHYVILIIYHIFNLEF
jgi:hypothetical protein